MVVVGYNDDDDIYTEEKMKRESKERGEAGRTRSMAALSLFPFALLYTHSSSHLSIFALEDCEMASISKMK